jgi:hypothetical protein
MRLNEALGSIGEIRRQLASAETFRGFRSLTVGMSGMLAIAAAAVQSSWLPDPTLQVREYVVLWVAIAAVNLLMVSAELAYRYVSSDSPLNRRQTKLAIGQFVPCLLAGAGVTLVIVGRHPDLAWMLPGLWALLFGLGAMASCRSLPTQTVWVAVYYLVTALICLSIGDGAYALSPWMMVATFGVGQFLAAGVLYFQLERDSCPQ